MGEQDYSVTTTHFSGDADGKVAALHIAQAEAAPPFAPVPGSERELPAQLVLLAMGFLHPEQPLLDQLGVEKDPRGNVKAVKPYTTSVDGVFAAGDARRGQSLIVWAINEGRQCARMVDRYLAGYAADPALASAPSTAQGWAGLKTTASPATPTPTKAPRGRRSTSGRAFRRNSDLGGRGDRLATWPTPLRTDARRRASGASRRVRDRASERLPRACIVGAGSSGIAAAKALLDRGIPFDCFEKSDQVGGNWVFGNRNGMSAAYRDLFINVSRERMAYADYPMPTSYPDFPHHTHIKEYFDDYVDHFGLREHISFETGVEHAAQARGRGVGGDDRAVDGERETRDVRRPAGRQRPPLGPTLARTGLPGRRHVRGRPSCTPTPTWTTRSSRARTWSYSGMGNSAMDIAVESSYVAANTYLAARKGAWIIPKYVFGRPVDQLPNNPRVPFAIRQRMIHQTIKTITGPPERYGLPKPDHKFGEAHPTVSGRILDRIAHGTIAPKPNIASLEGDTRALRRRQRGARRRGRVLHRLQDHLPLLRRRLPRRARQPHRAVPARLSPGDRRPLLHRPVAAARRDHAARRGPVAPGWATTCAGSTPCPRRPRCSATSPPTRPRCTSATWPPSVTRSRSTSTTTCMRWKPSAAPGPSGRGRGGLRCRFRRDAAIAASYRHAYTEPLTEDETQMLDSATERTGEALT